MLMIAHDMTNSTVTIQDDGLPRIGMTKMEFVYESKVHWSYPFDRWRTSIDTTAVGTVAEVAAGCRQSRSCFLGASRMRHRSNFLGTYLAHASGYDSGIKIAIRRSC